MAQYLRHNWDKWKQKYHFAPVIFCPGFK